MTKKQVMLFNWAAKMVEASSRTLKRAIEKIGIEADMGLLDDSEEAASNIIEAAEHMSAFSRNPVASQMGQLDAAAKLIKRAWQHLDSQIVSLHGEGLDRREVKPLAEAREKCGEASASISALIQFG